MSSTITGLSAPTIEQEETLSFNQVLQSAKKHIHEGMSMFKEEVVAFYDKSGDFIHRMTSPVNNFLKDHSQIENELQLEFTKECICAGTVDHEQAMYLEENY